jgi:glycosyltransferase involved in cell wall biosynthesis
MEVCCLSSDNEFQNQSNESIFLGQKYFFIHSVLKNLLPKSCLQMLTAIEWQRQLELLLKKHKPDIINFHNLHSANFPPTLISISLKYAPVVWTLHDCWSFLGKYYPQYCGEVDSSTLFSLNNFWSNQRKKPTRNGLSAVTPSAWMKDLALSSNWKNHLVKNINNPIPDGFFKNRDRKGCKSSLGLNMDKPVVLSIAGNLEEERKGGTILKEILQANSEIDAQFLLIGSGHIDYGSDSRVKNLGFVRDELTLQIAYHASDLLIHPAPIDNLPNTVAESMSCGTPVLAYHTGGLPEMVIPNKSGWLVHDITAASMIAELDSILISKDYEKLRQSTKEFAQLRFDSQNVAYQYKKHFESAITD